MAQSMSCLASCSLVRRGRVARGAREGEEELHPREGRRLSGADRAGLAEQRVATSLRPGHQGREGADHHDGALALARRGAQAAGVDALLRLERSDARAFEPTVTPQIVVTNPPYGKRIGRDEALVDSWQSLGNFLHRQCRGSTAWVLS